MDNLFDKSKNEIDNLSNEIEYAYERAMIGKFYTKYFRITGYNKEKDFSFIVDNNGSFNTLQEFVDEIKSRGNIIYEAGECQKFKDVNFDKLYPNCKDKCVFRCVALGKPEYIEQEIDYVLYKAIKVGYMIYIPDKRDCQY